MNVQTHTQTHAAEVLLGIRPEDIALSLEEGAACTASVYAVEPLGAEQLVTLAVTEKVHVRALVPAQQQVQLHQRLGLRIAPSKVHWFDANSGQRLAPTLH